MAIQRITPFLWFDNQAEEAAQFYASIFPHSSVHRAVADLSPAPKGKPLTVRFQLDGLAFVALNGGPAHKFNEAVSFVVSCQDQDELDYYWHKLLEGGEPLACGWLRDKFGLAWQVTPTILPELLADPDRTRAERAMKAMMNMVKLDIDELKRAHAGVT